MSSTVVTATTETRPPLETAAIVTLCLFVGALQFSIAASAVLLSLVLLLWAGMLVSKHEQVEVPSFFWPLVAYAGYTMVSVAASLDPLASLVDSREVLLFLVVPLVYRLASGRWAPIVATIVISVGAVNSAIGIWQYGILEFDTLGQRPQGSMGHYMTYSGLLMLVICLAAARVLFAGAERMWAALVLPALIAALAVTLTPECVGGRQRRCRSPPRTQRPSASRRGSGTGRARDRHGTDGDHRPGLFDLRPQ